MEKQKISRKFIHLNKLAVYSDLLTNTEKMHTQNLMDAIYCNLHRSTVIIASNFKN
jgi:hypothetical protein